MAGLCWMAVMLTFFLSAGDSVDVVDQNRLATIVYRIKEHYNPGGMFSLAVSIPDDQNINNVLPQVFTSDPVNDVMNTINNGGVYVGRRVVAAKALPRPGGGADHAESRVVDHLGSLFNSPYTNSHDLLLFYVFASPCVQKCLNTGHPGHILKRINVILQWQSYAVVFSKIFRPIGGSVPLENLRGALQQLGTFQGAQGQIGLDHIFRCYKPEGYNWMQCISCRSGNGVAHDCISDVPEPGPSQSLPSTLSQQPQQVRGASSSQRGGSGRGYGQRRG